jgi:hypothetical protein
MSLAAVGDLSDTRAMPTVPGTRRNHDVLDQSYRALLEVIEPLDDDLGWRPTRCAGWSARDLTFHLLGDTQRALVALHTPAQGPADVDAVSYWGNWQPGTPGADAGRRGVRISASAWSSVTSIAQLYVETAAAVLTAVQDRDGTDLLATQGHVIALDDLLSTLAVEATVHQLDLGLGHPSGAGLAEVRRVLDGLLGRPAVIADDIRYALVGTGREALSITEAAELGPYAGLFPLFG